MKRVVIAVIIIAVLGLGSYFYFSRSDDELASSSTATQSTPKADGVAGELQIAQRDTERRSDLGRLAAYVHNYSANNAGSLPQDITDVFIDAEQAQEYEQYRFVKAGEENVDKPGIIIYLTGFVCQEDSSEVIAGSSREFALLTKLEQGSDYCVGS